MQERGIKRGRINSEEDKQGKQEFVRGIKWFHLEGINVKWQLFLVFYKLIGRENYAHVQQQWAAAGWGVSMYLCVQLMSCLFESLLALLDSTISKNKYTKDSCSTSFYSFKKLKKNIAGISHNCAASLFKKDELQSLLASSLSI